MNIRQAIFRLLLPGLILISGLSEAQQREPSFPYNALVINESAKVYSGPGSVHYPTDELKQNATVDVYRHDPGGWCAIRPPASSFSLVPESVVQAVANSVGEISEDGVQAWVGTRFGSVEQPLWQVTLKKGEEVEIIGEVSWPDPEGNPTVWYQISPPAGEFRWIRMSDLKLPENLLDLPEVADDHAEGFSADLIPGVIRNDEIAGSDSVSQSGFQESAEPFDEPKLDPPSEKDGTVNRGWKKARRSIRIADRRIDSDNVEPFKIPAVDIPARTNATSSNVFDTSNGIEKPMDARSDLNSGLATEYPSRLTESVLPIYGQVSDRIRVLDAELTREMLKDPAQWQLESILRRATSISTATTNDLEREHANRLVRKIRNCTSIQSSYENAFEKINESNIFATSAVGTGVDGQVQLGTTYDAHGWLNELIRDKGKLSPTYVLEDDDGKIICHVSPAPGLNLNRYLKSKVGLIGRRGYHRELQMNHVTADRVVVLDKLRR